MRVLSAAILFIAIPCAAFADGFSLIGKGTNTCGLFAQEYRTNPEFIENLYFTWAMGYMGGLNDKQLALDGHTQELTSMSYDDQKSFLRAYCDNHPLARYFQGVLEIYNRLSPNNPVKISR